MARPIKAAMGAAQALEIVRKRDTPFRSLHELKLQLTLAERAEVLAQVDSKALRQRLLFVGFDDASTIRDRPVDYTQVPPERGRFGAPQLEDWIARHGMTPRLDAMLRGEAGQLAHETSALRSQLEELDAQGLEALRRSIERKLSPEANKKLVDRKPFKGKATIEKLLHIFSGEPFGSPAPLSFELLASAADTFSRLELPDGEKKAAWIERAARCPVIAWIAGWLADGVSIVSAFSNAQLEVLFPVGQRSDIGTWLLLGQNTPDRHRGIAAFIEAHGVARLQALLKTLEAVVPALLSPSACAESLKRNSLDSIAVGLEVLASDELGARCFTARKGVGLEGILESGLDKRALLSAITSAKRALALELGAIKQPARLPPDDPYPGNKVAPKAELPGLYDYPDGSAIYRGQRVLFEHLDSLLSYLSFLAPKELGAAERATRTRTLIADKGYDGIAEHQYHGTTGYAEYGNRLFIACSEDPIHAALYANRTPFLATGATVSVLARIRPDPERDPVFSSRRLTPEHKLVDAECALFGRPQPQRVDWFIPFEGRYYPILDQARLKAAVERLGGLSPSALDFMIQIGALGSSISKSELEPPTR